MDYYEHMDGTARLSTEGQRLYEMGTRHIGKTCVVILCGGQGTRLGYSGPKGCFVLPRIGKCLYDIHLDRIRQTERRHGTRIRVYLMTSTYTHAATARHMDRHADMGIVLFAQGESECLDMQHRVMMYDGQRACMAPNGNGGVFEAMFRNGVVDDMKRHGVECVNIVSVDNVLANTCDPLAVGVLYDTGADVVNKAVVRHENESAGVFVRENGRYVVREYFERTGTDGRHELANICHHYLRLSFIEGLQGRQETPHLSKKKIPFMRDGVLVQPTEPNGYKQELFIFDYFRHAGRSEVIVVPRMQEFSPLKNSDSEGCDCPATCASDYLAVQQAK